MDRPTARGHASRLTPFAQARIRRANDQPFAAHGDYVLYWMQAARRFDRNHALDHALATAREHRKPLVVYEGLRLDYPWASARHHHFVLEGMRDNARIAAAIGVNYWPFVETPAAPGRGLLRSLAARAVAVFTDDYPCFIAPAQTAALARHVAVPVIAVDTNGLVPLSLLGPAAYAASHLRRRLHKTFAIAWDERAATKLELDENTGACVSARFETWVPPVSLAAFVAALPIDQSVRPVATMAGGSTAAQSRLKAFIRDRLAGYADQRSLPAAPQDGHTSGLSPYLHFGHISAQELVEAALGRGYSSASLCPEAYGRREGFFGRGPDIDSFLDETITWRDIGHHWHFVRGQDAVSLKTALPAWALATLGAHAPDPRAHGYSLAAWEAAETHDPLWNAAQRELVATGTIHNYLRMLWGKKVIEWSRTPRIAYQTLVHLNNKYALDGRDPNSYSGILWCFGLFDRPWAPERPVLGSVRYMSSENTARKFRLGPYLDYVATLTA